MNSSCKPNTFNSTTFCFPASITSKDPPIFMVIFMIPMLISTVVLADVYIQALSENGVIGKFYQSVTGKDTLLLYNSATATPSILIFCLWTGFGLNLIMFNGSMSRIPESVVESAKLEGVGFWKELFSITLPMIWPTFSMLMMLSVTGVFASTGPIVLFANGSDLNISTIDFWMYQNVAAANGANKEYNLAAALGMILTIASLPIFLFVMWLRKKLNPEVTY
jgi:ABC-type sugar transport system permease subunit